MWTARVVQPASANPIGIGLAGTTIYVADDNHTIRKITSAGVVTSVAGTPVSLAALMAREPPHNSTIRYGVAADSKGNVYVADNGNCTIRKIVAATGVVTTLAGTAGVVQVTPTEQDPVRSSMALPQ